MLSAEIPDFSNGETIIQIPCSGFCFGQHDPSIPLRTLPWFSDKRHFWTDLSVQFMWLVKPSSRLQSPNLGKRRLVLQARVIEAKLTKIGNSLRITVPKEVVKALARAGRRANAWKSVLTTAPWWLGARWNANCLSNKANYYASLNGWWSKW